MYLSLGRIQGVNLSERLHAKSQGLPLTMFEALRENQSSQDGDDNKGKWPIKLDATKKND